MPIEPAVLIFDLREALMQSSEVDRAEVDILEAIVEFRQAEVLAGTDSETLIQPLLERILPVALS